MTDNVVHIHFAEADARRGQQFVAIIVLLRTVADRDVYRAELHAKELRDTGVISDDEFASAMAHIRPFQRSTRIPRSTWPNHVSFRDKVHYVLNPDDYEGPDAA